MVGFWCYNSLNLPSTRFPSNRDKWPSKAYRRSHFGQHVLWHEYEEGSAREGRHLSADALDPYRFLGDERFDEILELYAKEGQPLRAGDDLLERTSSHGSEADRTLGKTLAYYSRLPSWADEAQLKRGQDVFLAYFPAIGVSLYYRSLVPGFSIPKIAAVLQATAYLAPPASKSAVHERLMDTGAFLAACLQSDSVEAILPNGEGWKAALRVRVLHAKVRRQLLCRKGNRQWDTKHFGVPINQEDLAATLLAFSANSLLGAEFILGKPLPRQDRLDYLALWRYLGWMLGIDVDDEEEAGDNTQQHSNTTTRKRLRALDPCGPGWYPSMPNTLEHSYAIFQSLIMHTLHPDQSSVRMAHHLLRQGRREDGDNKGDSKEDAKIKKTDMNWFYFRSFQCRRFVGDELADALQLPLRPTWWGRLVQWGFSTLYLSIVSFYTIAGLPFSPLRQRLIRFHRTNMVTFMDTWTEGHLERMRRKLKIATEKESCCPFAMILNAEHEQHMADSNF